MTSIAPSSEEEAPANSMQDGLSSSRPQISPMGAREREGISLVQNRATEPESWKRVDI